VFSVDAIKQRIHYTCSTINNIERWLKIFFFFVFFEPLAGSSSVTQPVSTGVHENSSFRQLR
jgi:hypothetical protein